jgi:hypothetical protein
MVLDSDKLSANRYLPEHKDSCADVSASMKIYKSMMQIKGPTEALDYLLIR